MPITAIDFSSDGSFLCTGGNDILKIWDMNKIKIIKISEIKITKVKTTKIKIRRIKKKKTIKIRINGTRKITKIKIIPIKLHLSGS
jgi:WD40 repeat protein